MYNVKAGDFSFVINHNVGNHQKMEKKKREDKQIKIKRARKKEKKKVDCFENSSQIRSFL